MRGELPDALWAAYTMLAPVRFEDMYFRRDIGSNAGKLPGEIRNPYVLDRAKERAQGDRKPGR
jgi:hypothetical protein